MEETIPNVNIPNENVVPEPVVEKKRGSSVKIVIILMSLVILLLSSVVIYFLFFNDEKTPVVDNSETLLLEEEKESEEEDKIVTEVEEENDVANEKPVPDFLDYTNSKFGISFKYPEDWKVKESSSGPKNITITFSENRSNPEFVFEYYLPDATGPEFCYFNDYLGDDLKEPGGGGVLYDNYVEVGQNGLYRRVDITEEGSFKYIRVCKLYDSTLKTYINWMSDGNITYKVNRGRSDYNDMLDLMDKILLSFKYTKS